MRAVPDIIESWINTMPNEFTATSSSSGVITVTCTHWAVVGGKITIEGDTYTITEITDTTITINGTYTNTGRFTYSLAISFYTHGTPIQANIERESKRRNQDVKVTPMVYLFEPITESFGKSSKPTIDTNVRLAIMNNYTKDQFTDDIYATSIKAMRSFADDLVKHIKKQAYDVYWQDITHDITSWAKYGRFRDEKGSIKNLFNEELSGVELKIFLPLNKRDLCEC